MKTFHTTIYMRGYAANGHRTGTIKLATSNPESHMNLIIDETGRFDTHVQRINTTLNPVTAKALRDELLKAYPLEAKPVAPAVDRSGGLKVGDKVRVCTGRHGLSQWGGTGIVVDVNRKGWIDMYFVLL